MVVGAAVLALVAILDAVLIDKGDCHNLGVAAEPLSERIIGENCIEQTFQNITGNRLTGVVTCGQ